jgi:hypothetical protein
MPSGSAGRTAPTNPPEEPPTPSDPTHSSTSRGWATYRYFAVVEVLSQASVPRPLAGLGLGDFSSRTAMAQLRSIRSVSAA